MKAIEYKSPTLSLQVFKYHILATTKSFVRVTEEELNFLAEVAKKHFTGPFGLVEVRDKNVFMDPELHTKVKEVLPNFSSYALVTSCNDTLKNMEKEEVYMSYENFRLCSSISEATDWVNLILTGSYYNETTT